MPTWQEAEAAGNTSDVDADQQLVGELAGGDSLPDVPVPDVLLPEALLDRSVGEEPTSSRSAEKAMVVGFGSVFGSWLVRFPCCSLSLSGINYYTHRKVCGWLRVSSIYGFCIGFISFIVLWDIAHAAFLQLLACEEPPCDGVEAQ